MEELEVTFGTNYKFSLPVLCYKIPNPQIINNNLHNLYINFMVHYFHFEILQLYLKILVHNSFGIQPINYGHIFKSFLSYFK